MARLVHLNGAPGVGKSAVAHRYLEDHPLALLVDIDGIRTSLGRWEQLEESKLVARSLAIALVERQLREARDVVVPQYLGRHDFITTLEAVADDTGVDFAEVVLDAPHAVAVARFRSRRAELLDSGAHHPQIDVPGHAIEEAVEDAMTRLTTLVAERGDAIRVDATQPLGAVYTDVVTALREREP